MDIGEWIEEPVKIADAEKTEEFSMTRTIVGPNAEAEKIAVAEKTEETPIIKKIKNKRNIITFPEALNT
jgi:hypothetical protein